MMISHYETGSNVMSVPILEKYAAACGVSVAFFFEQTSQDGPPPLLPPPAGEQSQIDTDITGQTLLQLFGQQQTLLAEQQAISERQRQDVARLTEVIARQQEFYFTDRQFTQQQLARQVDRLQTTIDGMLGEMDRAGLKPAPSKAAQESVKLVNDMQRGPSGARTPKGVS